MQLSEVFAIFNTKGTHPASCLKKKVWYRLAT